MTKHIFVKYFAIISILILLSVGTLFTVMMGEIREYSSQTQIDELKSSCESMASVLKRNSYFDSTVIYDESIRNSAYILSSTLDAKVFVSNRHGDIIICTEAQPCRHVTNGVNSQILNRVDLYGYFSETGNFDNTYFDGEYFTYGTPITNGSNEFIGAVFASINLEATQSFYNALLGYALIVLLVVLVISWIVTYLLTLMMVRPIKAMSRVAMEFSDGNFSSRIKVRGKDELSELAAAFNTMADSLEQLEKMRSSFVTNVSHELKTPMTSISGFLEGILDGTIPPEQQKHYLTIVVNETHRLARLVKSLLYMSKVEGGIELPKESDFDFAKTLTDVIITLEPNISAKNIELEGLDWDLSLKTCGDVDMIHQVAYNLIENAIKYTPRDGTIAFSFESNSNRHIIRIKNHGAGIPHDDLPHIFERFYKVDKSRGLDSKSTGIGLYIVKTLLKIHGQDISANSDGKTYTEFVFTLKNKH